MIEPGQIRPNEKIIMKNASIFTPEGRKVTWGDFNEEDIKDMKGIYYVLNQHDSYFRVSKNVNHIQKLRPSFDPNRSEDAITAYLPDETVGLDPKYIREKAHGKIVDGKWYPNPINYKWYGLSIKDTIKQLEEYIRAGSGEEPEMIKILKMLENG